MAFRKNTAQAFEILRQIHAEEKLRGESARSPVSESEPKPQSGPMQAPGTASCSSSGGEACRQDWTGASTEG